MIWTAFLGLIAADPPSLETRCAAAESYIVQRVANERPTAIVFDIEPPFAPLFEGRARWVLPMDPADITARPVDTPGPSETMWARFAENGQRNAVFACETVRAFLKARGIAYGEAAVSRAVGDGKRRKWLARVVTVGLPTLSEDGSEAILIESNSCGPLCGGGSAYHLRRDADGNWRPVAFTGLYVS